jgi:hypothetical protein
VENNRGAAISVDCPGAYRQEPTDQKYRWRPQCHPIYLSG